MPGAIMRIHCANCSTEYDVPDAAFRGRARKVRCGRCRHEWFCSVPAAQGRAPEPVPAPAPVQVEEPEAVAPAAVVDDEPPVGMWPVVRPAPAEAAADPVFASRSAALLRPDVPETKQSKWPGLLILFVAMAVLLVMAEHRAVVRLLPGTAGYFAALGLS